jgi:hypothetical protein
VSFCYWHETQELRTSLRRFENSRNLEVSSFHHGLFHGSMDARLLYDSPYTDFSPRGVDGVFESREVDELVSILDDVKKRAVG